MKIRMKNESKYKVKVNRTLSPAYQYSMMRSRMEYAVAS
jgi:hypothetical protein